MPQLRAPLTDLPTLQCKALARVLNALVRVYGKPAFIVSEIETEFASRAILKWAGDNDVEWHHIDPGKPHVTRSATARLALTLARDFGLTPACAG